MVDLHRPHMGVFKDDHRLAGLCNTSSMKVKACAKVRMLEAKRY